MTDGFTFEPATKAQAKARIALAGPSGSGKTWTALTLAQSLGKSIAVIDTERGSASKYAGPFTFQRLNMQRYDPRDLPKALAAAASRGFDVVIVDSLSKFWAGQGGMLEQVDNAARRGYGGNSFGGWKEARPMETAMIEALLSYPGHVIVTMRTKTAYEIIEDDRGRKVPTKIGLKPEQRDGIEYEFDIVGDMDLENTLTISKSRCSALSGEVIRRPGSDLADAILAWLSDGLEVLSAMDYRDQALSKSAAYAELKALYFTVKAAGLLGASVPDESGEAMSLGQLIVSRGKEAEARETFSAEAEAQAATSGTAFDAPAGQAAPPQGTQPPARIRPEDQGAPKAQQATTGADDDAEWVQDFAARLADTPEDGLGDRQREIGQAVGARKIKTDTAKELTDMVKARRSALQEGQMVPA